MKFPKIKRETDPKFVHWIHGFECLVCKRYPVQAHHVVSRGAGGSDRTCVPLCHEHHTGVKGVHLLGVLHFQKKYNLDLNEESRKLNEKFDQGEEGPHHHLLPQYKEGVLRSS